MAMCYGESEMQMHSTEKGGRFDYASISSRHDNKVPSLSTLAQSLCEDCHGYIGLRPLFLYDLRDQRQQKRSQPYQDLRNMIGIQRYTESIPYIRRDDGIGLW